MSSDVEILQRARASGVDWCRRTNETVEELRDKLYFFAIFIICGAGCFIVAYSIPNTSIHFPRLKQAGAIFVGLSVMVIVRSIFTAACNLR